MSFTRRHPLLIYITLITLTLIVIGLIGFLINRLKVDDAVLGLVEVLVTIAIGLLSNVVAAGWFILLFQRHDASRMEFLATTVKNIDATCQILYKRGIWVANKRADLNNAFYEKHYNTAHKVYILGIANKGFMRNFFPKYVENDFTLDTVKEQPLFKRLKSTPGFWVTVLFLDPDSPYARTRNLERDNSRTIQDLREIVSALEKIRNAYLSAATTEDWKINGRLEFMMFNENPHSSIFQAQADKADESIMVVGLLPKNMSGDECPSVIMHQNPDHTGLFNSYEHHLREIKNSSKTLLRWDDRGIEWF